MRRVPDNIRVAGWTAALVGGLLTGFGVLNIFLYAVAPEAAGPPRGAHLGPVAAVVFSHPVYFLAAYLGLAGFAFASGLELSRGKEVGRHRLTAALWAGIVLTLAAATAVFWGFLTMPAPPSDLTGLITSMSGRAFHAVLLFGGIVGTVAILGLAALLYLAIRWLNSPRVRDACRRDGAGG